MIAEGRLLDLVLHEVDRLHRAAELVDLGDQLLGTELDLVGQRLDEVRTCERIDRVGYARLIGDDLLGPQRDLGRPLGRQRQCLVEPVRVERLRAAADGGEPLESDSNDVVLGLLGGQRHAAGLGVEPQPPRTLILGPEPLAHDFGPHPPGGPELRDLLEDVVVAVEEEGQPRPELVDLKPGVECRLHVGDPVGERERDLLDGRAPLLAEVVSADRDRVPLRHPFVAVREQIRGQADRALGRIDEVAPGDVLLEDVVLGGTAKLFGRDPLLLAHQLVEEQQHRRRRVDRHRGRDLVERESRGRPSACRRSSRSRRPCGRPRRGSAGHRSRARAGSGGRTPCSVRSSRARAGSGSARLTPWRSHSPRTGAGSTAACGTCRGGCLA